MHDGLIQLFSAALKAADKHKGIIMKKSKIQAPAKFDIWEYLFGGRRAQP